MKAVRVFPVLLLLAGTFGCKNEVPGFQLQIDLRNAQQGICYLYRLSADGDPVLADSFQTSQLDHQFTLADPGAGPLPSVYQLTLTAARASLYVISDAPEVRIRINANDPYAYETEGSSGSLALQQFQHLQKPLTDSLYILSNKIENRLGDTLALAGQARQTRERLQSNLRGFADTVSAPLAALFLAPQIEFGGDLPAHRRFIDRLEARFPDHPGIRKYVDDTRGYFSLQEVEYQVGDTLPLAVFSDWYGKQVDLSSFRGRFTLLEFWASYCPACLNRLFSFKPVYARYRDQGLAIVAFSLDPDRPMLEQALQAAQFPWPVVADLKGWSGKPPLTYKIDSIPFNFLIGPDGRIAAKNVDSRTLGAMLGRR